MNQQEISYGSVQHSFAPTLMEAFEFTADDLSANRMGTATEKQLAQIKAARGHWQMQILRIIGVMFLIGAAYIILTPQGVQIRDLVARNPMVAAIGIGFVLLIYVIMLGSAFLGSQRMTVSKVSSASGQFKPVGKPLQAVDGTVYQRAKIGKREFYMTEDQADALTAGPSYTVYFTGGGQMVQIVSVEQMAAN